MANLAKLQKKNVIFDKEDIIRILVKFESEFLWIFSFEKHKLFAFNVTDSAELPTRKGHSFSLLHRKPTPCMGK